VYGALAAFLTRRSRAHLALLVCNALNRPPPPSRGRGTTADAVGDRGPPFGPAARLHDQPWALEVRPPGARS